jgi:hypothetical protein
MHHILAPNVGKLFSWSSVFYLIQFIFLFKIIGPVETIPGMVGGRGIKKNIRLFFLELGLTF